MEDTSLNLKEQVQLICTKLNNMGEQSLFLSVNPSNQTSTFLGSATGMEFLQKRMDIIEKFYKMCSGQEFVCDDIKKNAETMTDICIQPTSQEPVFNLKSGLVKDSIKTTNFTHGNNSELKETNKNVSTMFSSSSASVIQDSLFSSENECDDIEENNDDSVNDAYSKNENQPTIIEKASFNSVDENQPVVEKASLSSVNSDIKDVAEVTNNDDTLTNSWKSRLNRKRKIPQVVIESKIKKEKKPKTEKIVKQENRFWKQIKSKKKTLADKAFDIFMREKKKYHAVRMYVDEDNMEFKNSEDCSVEECRLEGNRDRGYFMGFENISEVEIVKKLNIKSKKIVKKVPKPTKIHKLSPDVEFERSEDGGYICSYCRKVYKRPGQLRNHRRTHTKERPLKCNLCEKTFMQYSHLSRHKITHNPSHRPFMCDICGKTFPHRDHLTSHKQVHEEPKQCTCPNCGKVFAREKLLQQHMRLEQAGYSHMCDICGKSFRLKDTLNKHLLTHQEDRKPEYKCTECNKEFFRKTDLKAHIDTKHLGIQYKNCVCDCCDVVFSSRSAVLRHKRRKAGLYPRKSNNSKKIAVKSEQFKINAQNQSLTLPIKIPNSTKHMSFTASTTTSLNIDGRGKVLVPVKVEDEEIGYVLENAEGVVSFSGLEIDNATIVTTS